jgi:hypothetical protein
VSSFITTHHELCDGDDCNRWDCASLPENVGQWREGFVVAVNEDGSVEIEWSDGTRGTLQRKRKPSARELLTELVEAGK